MNKILLIIICILLICYIINKKDKEYFNEIIKKKFNNSNFLIMTLATENYSDNLNLSLNMFKKSNPNQIVNIYCINWSKNIIYKFKKKFPKFIFIDYYDSYISDNLKSGKVKSGYVIKLKIKLIYDSYIKNKKNLLMFDADTKTVNKIDKILNLMHDYDILITFREKETYIKKFATGVIGFSYNTNTKNFLKKYYNYTMNNIIEKKYEIPNTIDGWWHDQIGFYKTYNEFPKLRYYFFNEYEHNLSGKHNPKQIRLKNSIFQSW